MSLFSRIDRIRGGRGETDREEDGVFAIPDLGKAGAPASPPPMSPAPEAAPPASPTAKGSMPSAAPFVPPPQPVAAPSPAPDESGSEAPPKRLSPLERLARRTAELEEGEDSSGNLPDPVIPERPPLSQLAERFRAEPLEDAVAAPIVREASDEEMPATMAADEEEVPFPVTPFRRPALFDNSTSNGPAAEEASPREPVSEVAWAGLTVPPLESDEQEPENVDTRLDSQEEAPPAFESAIPPAPMEVPDASAVPIEEPPASTPSPASGGTAFDRLMAARANAETPRVAAPSLADRLKAMRANATSAAQARNATPETAPESIISETPVGAESVAAPPEAEAPFDPEARLEDVLPPVAESEQTEAPPAEFEAQAEPEVQEEEETLPEPVSVNSAAESAIAMPPSSLDVPEAEPDGAEVPQENFSTEAPRAEMQEAAVASAPPPPFVPVEIPPAPPAPEPVQAREEAAPVAPPLPWEVEREPSPPALTGLGARLGVPPVTRVEPQTQPAAPVAPPEPVVQVPSSPPSMWAQRLAGRDALRDSPVAPSRQFVENTPEPANTPTSALERAGGELARTGGEGVAGESEARNRALYRQKHFIFDAVLGSLDGRALQNPTRDSVKGPIERSVDSAIREFNLPLSPVDRNWMVEEFVREVTDLGPLVGLLEEVTVNKILVVGSTDVAVERLGRIERTGVSFRDDDHLLSVVRRIADMTGGRIDAKVPLLDRPLPDGARIRAKIPPLAPQPTLTVEKSTGNPFTALKRQQADRGRENALPYSQLRERIQQRLLREFEGNAAALANPDRLRGQVEEMIGLVIAEEKVVVSRAERASLVMDLLNEIVGLGPIEPLLNDPEVDEVMVNGPFQIYVERKGKLEIAPQRFRDNNHVMQVIERIVAPLGRRVDEKSPMVDGRLRDGSRFNAIIPPLALGGPTMTIRKFARDPLTMTDLINFGSLSREAAQFLQAAVEGKLNIIVSGGTGSGKTTTLNVLSSFIPATDRIVTIEDAAELQLRQEHVIRLETRPANIEGSGEISIRDLVRNSLRMRPDRIVVGECRGGEALDMLQAMNTGHDGSLTTAHSNGPRDTLKRLETMVMMAGFDLPVRAIREQVTMAVQLVVHQERMRDGKRRITAITELVGMEGDVITMQDIFRFEQDRVDEEGRIIGTLAATGLRPQNFDNIVDHGANLSMDLFQPRSINSRDGDLRSRLSEHRIGTR
ncbi:putative conjugal transfer protein [Abditibacteriota bacterium]|nr:putative conjugal transfer protein [Abditibacteriota bacterium]